MKSDRENISKLLKACIKNKRSAQKALYKHYYSYAMSICLRYSPSRDDAVEVMNDGFMKIFTYLKSFDLEKPFQPWLRRIMVNAAIDHYKKQLKHQADTELNEAMNSTISDSQLDMISYQEILELVRGLPPAYRAVFNLYAIEGYKHEEIAEMLGISVGTSKSNYFKAKRKLKESLHDYFGVNEQ